MTLSSSVPMQSGCIENFLFYIQTLQTFVKTIF